MKKKKNSVTGSIFMYICTILAVFLTVSGTIMVQTIEGTILQILFLPITIFLLISSINQLFYKSPSAPQMKLKTSKGFITSALIIFFLLMFLGIRGVAKSQDINDKNITTINVDKADSTSVIESSKNNESSVIVIKADNPKAVISVREKPNDISPIIYQARVGQEFIYIKNEEDWYEIKLGDDKTGWLKASNIEIKE